MIYRTVGYKIPPLRYAPVGMTNCEFEMSKDKRIYKPSKIAGFPEWLPEERLVEQKWFDHIRRVFESYGFCNIETPSVEELDVLTAKGEVDKEIYVIERLHKDPDEKKRHASRSTSTRRYRWPVTSR